MTLSEYLDRCKTDPKMYTVHPLVEQPIYVLSYKLEWSFDTSPLVLFWHGGVAERVSSRCNIPLSAMEGILDPKVRRWLIDAKGNLADFRVIKVRAPCRQVVTF